MLSNKRITLSGLTAEDKNVLFQWINDSELVRHNSSYRPIDWHSHCDWFEKLAHDSSKVVFGIRLNENGKLIGVIQLISINSIHRSAELIIRIGEKDQQGDGLGSEALASLIKYAWNDLNLNRIYLHVFANNERAIAAYKKTGFIEEGRLRRAVFIDGNWHDVLVMGLLREQD